MIFIAAAAVVVTLIGILHSMTTTTVRDGSGKITSVTTTTSEDPVPFGIEVNGALYTIDTIGIVNNTTFPEELVGCESANFTNVGKQITGYKLDSFNITSIV